MIKMRLVSFGCPFLCAQRLRFWVIVPALLLVLVACGGSGSQVKATATAVLAPTVPALTADEQAYFQKVDELNAHVGVAAKKLVELTKIPEFTSKPWKNAFGVQIGVLLSTNGQFARLSSPSKRFDTYHNLLSQAYAKITEGANLAASGVDHRDSTLLTQGFNLLDEGKSLLNQAADEKTRIKSAIV